jgi:hypothetical protein
MARHAARTLPSSAAIANTRRRNRYSRSSCVTATRPFSSTWSSRRRMRRHFASVGDVPRCRYISGIGHSRARYRDKLTSLKQLVLAAGQQAGAELIWRRGGRGLQRSHFLALRVRPGGSPASPGRRPCWQPRLGAAGAVAIGRMGSRQGRAGQVLAVEPTRHDPDGAAGLGWASCAGGSSRTTANARAPGLDHYEGHASPAGTIT